MREQPKDRAVLLSVFPKFAHQILAGVKKVELRKVCPKITKGGLILLYVTSPEKSLRAILRIDKIESGSPDDLWAQTRENVGLSYSEFKDYFNGTTVGHAIFFDKIVQLSKPLPLATLKALIPGFQPPRVHRYLSIQELNILYNEFGNL